jgi:hypothetical protein
MEPQFLPLPQGAVGRAVLIHIISLYTLNPRCPKLPVWTGRGVSKTKESLARNPSRRDNGPRGSMLPGMLRSNAHDKHDPHWA